MYAPAIELDPGVYPRIVHVGLIGVGLLGEDHESLTCMELVARLVSILVLRDQCATPRYDVMKQIVVSLRGSK